MKFERPVKLVYRSLRSREGPSSPPVGKHLLASIGHRGICTIGIRFAFSAMYPRVRIGNHTVKYSGDKLKPNHRGCIEWRQIEYPHQDRRWLSHEVVKKVQPWFRVQIFAREWYCQYCHYVSVSKDSEKETISSDLILLHEVPLCLSVKRVKEPLLDQARVRRI